MVLQVVRIPKIRHFLLGLAVLCSSLLPATVVHALNPISATIKNSFSVKRVYQGVEKVASSANIVEAPLKTLKVFVESRAIARASVKRSLLSRSRKSASKHNISRNSSKPISSKAVRLSLVGNKKLKKK